MIKDRLGKGYNLKDLIFNTDSRAILHFFAKNLRDKDVQEKFERTTTELVLETLENRGKKTERRWEKGYDVEYFDYGKYITDRAPEASFFSYLFANKKLTDGHLDKMEDVISSAFPHRFKKRVYPATYPEKVTRHFFVNNYVKNNNNIIPNKFLKELILGIDIEPITYSVVEEEDNWGDIEKIFITKRDMVEENGIIIEELFKLDKKNMSNIIASREVNTPTMYKKLIRKLLSMEKYPKDTEHSVKVMKKLVRKTRDDMKENLFELFDARDGEVINDLVSKFNENVTINDNNYPSRSRLRGKETKDEKIKEIMKNNNYNKKIYRERVEWNRNLVSRLWDHPNEMTRLKMRERFKMKQEEEDALLFNCDALKYVIENEIGGKRAGKDSEAYSKAKNRHKKCEK